MPETATRSPWLDDLDRLVAALRDEHRDLFHTVSAEAFRRATARLRLMLPRLQDHQAIVALAELVAMVGDGHTVLRLHEVPSFRRFPVAIDVFSDGIFARIRTDDRPDGIMGRLLHVAGTPALDAYERMRPLVSRDNEMGMLATAPAYLTIPEVLHAVGIADTPTSTRFGIETTDGEALEVDVTAVSRDAEIFSREPDDVLPLYRQRGGANWFTKLDDDQTLYLALNAIRESEDEPLWALFDQVFATIASRGLDRLVIDVRNNSGGNNLLNQSLIHHLVRADRINRWGHLYAIIGRRTFSAAINLCSDLERHTRTLFVGEPTGSAPNHYGENAEIRLPRSGLKVSASRYWWLHSIPEDDRAWIAPDLPARLSSRDHAAHRDPALAAALAHRPGPEAPPPFPDRIYRQMGWSPFDTE